MLFTLSIRHKTLKRLSLSLTVAAGIALVDIAAAQQVISVGGTGTGTLLIQRAAEAYSKSQRGVQVKAAMPPLGSNGGLRAVSAGAIQIAVVTIPTIYAAQSENIAAGKAIPWTRTPFVFTGRDLPSGTEFQIGQVANIYAGRVTEWQDGKQVRLVTRTERESDTRILRAISPEMNDAVALSLKRSGLPFAENDIDNQQLLERTPGSFGAIGLGQMLLTKSPLKPVSLNGVQPSTKSLQSGAYPFEKPLFLVISSTPSAGTLDFVRYLQSPEVMKIVGRYGFIPMQR